MNSFTDKLQQAINNFGIERWFDSLEYVLSDGEGYSYHVGWDQLDDLQDVLPDKEDMPDSTDPFADVSDTYDDVEASWFLDVIDKPVGIIAEIELDSSGSIFNWYNRTPIHEHDDILYARQMLARLILALAEKAGIGITPNVMTALNSYL